ncbi:MAG: peptidoglycan-associated lipoprotein Pal [Acidobacteria bacterium]|nr:peptidoglycan-associated lipoprotein Pal [Acidobacteriota bacterium]MBW4043465.1 peptidoglycan-associated lipoprotein Pal [Acidobacteriota bacterium]
MQRLNRKIFVSTLSVVALLTVAGCHKKQAAPPPPPPPTVTAPTPTAEITVTPNTINAGDSAVLTWKTTGANDVSIEGMGQVATSGTQNVKPTESTSYHLVARGDGGSTDATARITVNAAPPATSNLNENNVDDATFHQNVKDVFYDYDSYDITGDGQSTIQQDAAFLKAHPQLKVVIGGYCDERGSTEYNLALGENRANAAKQGLVNAGVDASQLRTVSYGKEKQFCTEHNESCWQQNRRAQFSVDR